MWPIIAMLVSPNATGQLRLSSKVHLAVLVVHEDLGRLARPVGTFSCPPQVGRLRRTRCVVRPSFVTTSEQIIHVNSQNAAHAIPVSFG